MPESVDHHPVVIIGSGPTGMTAALLLAQYGISCSIMDRWEGVYPQPRAVHMDDEVYRILGGLGLAEEFAAISRPARGLQLVDRRLTTLAVFDRDPDRRPHGFPQANMFDQPDLEYLMRSRLSSLAGVHMAGGCTVVDVANRRDHCVVTYLDTRTGERCAVTADYVLGCDGANSTVRSSIGSRMLDLGFEQRWLVIDIATEAELDLWEGVHQVCDTERAATYMRIGHTRHRWEFRLRDTETADDFDDLDSVRPLLTPWLGTADRDALHLIRSTEYTFRARVVDRWRDRRIFVLGDAAHLTPPFIGQGMGAGVRDAMNLVWKLVGVMNGSFADDTLDSYEAERKPHVTSSIRLAVAIGRAMTGGGAITDAVRKSVAPVLGHLPMIGAQVTDSTSPRLSPSNFVTRKVLSRGLAGSLCPNAVVDRGRRVDDVAPGCFLFVSTTPLTREQNTEVVRRGATALEVPQSSELGMWLHRRRANAAIVRPDRTVMAAGRSVPSLHTRLPSCAYRIVRSSGDR
ncbi:3-(3-hydroxyphenyl)propionate hydroxylase [Rhodococcus sp. 06-621-2]|nr:bifunctional 3-(3-hydroxy-phenyl)propionate/3-hydroxycinnamic acid hydroxylase [Rhodococcus sp. 06-621-2]OZC45885.1 3-(3-hydroxyphenyl)propionate hydroxylase [Rhodococcus sp. 06-621-2]